MLQRFLMILVCWPLLLPPGYCICQLETFALRLVQRPVVADCPDQTESLPRCRCCRGAKPDVPPDRSATCRPASTADPVAANEPAPSGGPATRYCEATRVSLPAAKRFHLGSTVCYAPAPAWSGRASSAPLCSSRVTSTDCLVPGVFLFSCNFRC